MRTCTAVAALFIIYNQLLCHGTGIADQGAREGKHYGQNIEVDLPVDHKYKLEIIGPDDNAVAIVRFSASSSGTRTTGTIPVSASTGIDVDIDLGAIETPDGTGAAGSSITRVTPEINPPRQRR